jgi:hypothetical protein
VIIFDGRYEATGGHASVLKEQRHVKEGL